MNVEWNDWRWQLGNAVRKSADLETKLVLSDDERLGLARLGAGELPLRITPHFLSLMDPVNTDCPLRRQVVPRASEFAFEEGLRRDPLGEEDHEVVPHLVHRYPDRVLLLVTDRCATYCRFCTRKRWVGQGPTPRLEHLTQALAYIRNHPEVEEVIISGGDPLLLGDAQLRSLLQEVRAIDHVQVLRIHTRMLAFAPMRVTPELVGILREAQPLYIVTHFNHSLELSTAALDALKALCDAGIPVINQNVLLRGINDSKEALTALFKKLVRNRVRPYYLHQCDVVLGTTAFRVPFDEAVALYQSLRGHVSGLCLPTLVIDIPGGFGKVPVGHNAIEARDAEAIYLKGFDGEMAAYPLN